MRTIDIYEFHELSSDQKVRAIELYKVKYAEVLFDDADAQYLKESMELLAEEKGYPELKAEFSLSYSQGDGVRFTGELDSADIEALAQRLLEGKDLKHLKWVAKSSEFSMFISSNGSRYVHELTMYCYFSYDNSSSSFSIPRIQSLLERLERLILNDLRSICKECERMGYREIEFHESDDYAMGCLDANNYEFEVSEEGEVVRIL